MANINDILNKIKKINNTSTVTLPSNKKEITVKQLNVKQQKNIKNLPRNVTLAVVSLFKEVNEIIRENCDISLDELNTIDRIILLLVFKNQISDTYKGIPVADILKQALSRKYKIQSKQTKTKNFIFEYNIPSLKRDNEISKYILKEYNDQTASVRDESELEILATKTYNNMMIPEICKYITSLKVISNEEEIDTNWNTLSITQQLSILESIPYPEIKDVLLYSEEIKNIEDSYTKYKFKDQTGREIDLDVEFNFDFFNIK